MRENRELSFFKGHPSFTRLLLFLQYYFITEYFRAAIERWKSTLFASSLPEFRWLTSQLFLWGFRIIVVLISNFPAIWWLPYLMEEDVQRYNEPIDETETHAMERFLEIAIRAWTNVSWVRLVIKSNWHLKFDHAVPIHHSLWNHTL